MGSGRCVNALAAFPLNALSARAFLWAALQLTHTKSRAWGCQEALLNPERAESAETSGDAEISGDAEMQSGGGIPWVRGGKKTLGLPAMGQPWGLCSPSSM